jgi:hypothetical protein
MGSKPIHLSPMAAVEPVREKQSQRLAQHLVGLEAEDALSRPIEDDDPLRRIDHQEGIANGLTKRGEISGRTESQQRPVLDAHSSRSHRAPVHRLTEPTN